MRHLSFACLIALPLFASCGLPQFEVAPRVGLMSLNGDFGTSSGALTTNADLDRIGLDDAEAALGLRADFKWGVTHLVAQTTQVDFSGAGTLDATLSQGGTVIPLGTAVESELDFANHSALLLWDVFPGNMVELSAGFGLGLLDFKFDVTDTGTAQSVRADETLPVPLLAANAGVMLGGLEANLLVSGFNVSADGNSGSFVDIDASLRWKLLGGQNHVRSSILLGWREMTLEVDYDDDGDTYKGEIGISGPYVSFEFTL